MPMRKRGERLPRIFKVLDASTGHLPVSCRHGDWPIGIIARQFDEYGYMVWVPDEPLLEENLSREENSLEPEPYPSNYEWVLRMQCEAREMGCDYILFDRDAEQVPGWYVFEEAEEATPEILKQYQEA